MTTPCVCNAYPFPHRPGGGDCRASGETTCPNCDVVLDDTQVTWALWAMATRYCPAEHVAVLVERCNRCGALGMTS